MLKAITWTNGLPSLFQPLPHAELNLKTRTFVMLHFKMANLSPNNVLTEGLKVEVAVRLINSIKLKNVNLPVEKHCQAVE